MHVAYVHLHLADVVWIADIILTVIVVTVMGGLPVHITPGSAIGTRPSDLHPLPNCIPLL